MLGAGASLGIATWELVFSDRLVTYIRSNEIEPVVRKLLLLFAGVGIALSPDRYCRLLVDTPSAAPGCCPPDRVTRLEALAAMRIDRHSYAVSVADLEGPRHTVPGHRRNYGPCNAEAVLSITCRAASVPIDFRTHCLGPPTDRGRFRSMVYLAPMGPRDRSVLFLRVVFLVLHPAQPLEPRDIRLRHGDRRQRRLQRHAR